MVGSNWIALAPPSVATHAVPAGHDTEVSGVLPSTDVGPAVSFWVEVIVVGSKVSPRPPSSTAVHWVPPAQESAVGWCPNASTWVGTARLVLFGALPVVGSKVISLPPRSTATH